MFARTVLLLLVWSGVSTQAAVLVTTNSTWSFLRGTNEASFPDTLAWTGTNVDTRNFVSAAAPFWYGATTLAGGTRLDDMQGHYSCFFLRKGFLVTNAAQIGAFRLSYFVDDGVVMWINGREVLRDNVPLGPLTTNTLATRDILGPVTYTNVLITPASGVFLDGSNTLAIQIFNSGVNNEDVGFDCFLEAFEAETIPPVIVDVQPPPGLVRSLTQVTVTFSEPVVGVTADDFLINTQPASLVSGDKTTYTFTFAQPDYGAVFVSWFADPGIVDLALPPNTFDGQGPGATWRYDLLDDVPPTVTGLFPLAGATVRALGQVEVTFSEEVTGVDAADLWINGQAASSVSRLPGGPYVFQFPSAPSGPVTLQWAPGHNIFDQAVPANPFGGGVWSYFVDPSGTVGNLVLNEVLALNQDGLTDEDGEAQDWIELYNRGNTSVDLGGWSLSDNPALPGLWVFPSRALGPGEYLVVFASGKDRKAPARGARLHTNFKLARSEYLGLYNSDSPRALVSSFAPEYPEQRNDYSYGYDPQGNLRYFAHPTPGGPNGPSTINGVTAPVHFSTARGLFTQPFNLSLNSATPGAQIRYTTNGAEPTLLSGLIYSGALPINGTTLIRAAAFRTNLLPSTVSTHSYFFNQSAAIRSLPIVSLVTATSNLFGRSGILGMGGGSRAGDGLFITNNPATDFHNPSMHGVAWERPVSVEWIRPEDNSGFQIDCGVRVQGSDWQRPRTMPTSKFSLRLYFRGDYGGGRLQYPAFPTTTLESFDQMVLRAGYNEAANPFIRDELVRRLLADMGNVSAQGTFVHVFTNGFYAGYYNPCERVHEEFAQDHHGGSNNWDVVAPLFAESSEGLGVVDGDRNDFNNLHTYIVGQNDLSIVNPAVYNEIARRLDLPNFVDYCVLNVYAAMGDWPANNFRAARDRGAGGIWRFYVWDAEWGLGYAGRGYIRDTFTENGPGPTDSGLASTANSEIARIYQSLRRNPEFRLLWADRIYKHFFNGGALTELAVTNRLSEMRTQLSGVFSMTMTELGPFLANRRASIFDYFNRYGLFGYSNTLYGVYASSNAPVFNQHGGPVPPGFALTMTAPLGGTIFFTLDGTDPRVRFSGDIAPTAVPYTLPLVLSGRTLVKARAVFHDTNWSALAEATFAAGDPGTPLRLTEIMYNPIGGGVYEFLEVQNIGGAPVDLGGMYFSEGIQFTFPNGTRLAAGAWLVLANDTDPAAFAARYPGIKVGGYFAGNLNNAGERITLRDTAGRIVFTVNYRDENGWPKAADGAGYSLELTDPLGDLNDPANWHPSLVPGGSPGAGGAGPPLGAVRLNEVLADNAGAVRNGPTQPDYVELANVGSAPATLTGWSLSDDGSPGKFRFPVGTVVPAGGYLIVWCDAATNITPGFHAGFELDAAGDGAFLFDSASNRVDAVTFGRQAPDLSLGRVDGNWQLTVPTPLAANVPALVGSVTNLALNEWMANPKAGQSDWVELYNRSASQAVPLYGLYVATTSSVQRLVSLSFLAPHAFLQLSADEGTGPSHLSFHLPAAGGSLSLLDPAGVLFERVNYTSQSEGISQGRLPDGTANIVNFPGSASPEAPNYAADYSGPLLNEVLARNVTAVAHLGHTPAFVELFNAGPVAASLAGMSLSVGQTEPGQWSFPAGATIPPSGYLVVWCDGERPASFVVGDYNTGRSLDAASGGAYLFNAAGQLVDSVEYGPQVQDQSIGRSDGQWRLLAAATPGGANAAPAALGPVIALRFNEWMANPANGPDWLELYNPGSSPVDLGGLRLTDDLSASGTNQFVIPRLSFAGPGGFVSWIADGQIGDGRNHLNFSLDAQGEGLRLYSTNGASIIDTVVFGPQLRGVSEGRLPDGSSNVVRFPDSATPAAANYLPIPDLVISEVLTYAQPPLEQAVELHNAGAEPLSVGGWLLSDSQADFKKYRLPDGATITQGGYWVLYEDQFGAGPTPVTFHPSANNEIWISAADSAGNLTGYRVVARVGAALSGVSFGRYPTSVGVDYAALSNRSFGRDAPSSVADFRLGTGLANAEPRVGPVVINEIQYHPPGGAGAGDEYIELLNAGSTPVALFDGAVPAHTWSIAGGVRFVFPADVTLAAGASALVVGFDPADVTALDAFRQRNGVAPGASVYGPFQGKLDNAGERIDLVRPGDAPAPEMPDAGVVPYAVVDRVEYTGVAPWPAGPVDGGGFSLQRIAPLRYGNEPLNWIGAPPTPGAVNAIGPLPPPVIIAQPASQTLVEGTTPRLEVSATGDGSLGYQWRFNRLAIPGATNSSLSLSYAISEDSGSYDVIVTNPGGAALSQAAVLSVVVPPVILLGPADTVARAGNNVTFGVMARGDPPLHYQWSKRGTSLPGETNATLTRLNVQLADEDTYQVTIANPFGTVGAAASLQVWVNPAIVQGPVSQTVVVGGQVTLSAAFTGNPSPFTSEWRRLAPVPLMTNVSVLSQGPDFFTFTAPLVPQTNLYRFVVRNMANPGGVGSAIISVVTLADTDHDGIPDVWESQYGFAGDRDGDLDGDGMSNWREYLAGTDPNDAASSLWLELSQVPGATRVRFNAVSNHTYTLQYAEGANGPWQRLADILARSTNRLESISDAGPATNRFYRVVTPRQP